MMLVGSSVGIRSVGCESADIGGSSVPFQTTVTYLGVHLDQTLSMKQHSSSVCRTTFRALRRIASIRPFPSNSSTEKLVASMIMSRLDYCNATFAGVADGQIARRKKIQNNAAWFILKKIEASSCYTAFERTLLAPTKTPHSVQAHFDGTLPPYLSSSLCTYQPSRSLRSSTEGLLTIPKTNLKTFGGRPFAYIAPTVWNSLPADPRASPSLQSLEV